MCTCHLFRQLCKLLSGPDVGRSRMCPLAKLVATHQLKPVCHDKSEQGAFQCSAGWKYSLQLDIVRPTPIERVIVS